MKKLVFIPIIIGLILLITGSFILLAGLKNNKVESVVNTYELTGQSYDNINIELSIDDLEFIPTNDDSIKIECVENKYYSHNIKVEDNCLIVESVSNKKWYERAFTFDITNHKVKIYMPAKSYNNLTIKSSTGDIKVLNAFTFNNVTITLSTGDIDYNANVVNKLSLTSSTGEIVLNGVVAEDLDLKSSTGDITLNNVVISNHINVNSSTGNIKFNDSDAQTLNIETSTGDIKGTLLTNKIFQVHKSTGKYNVPESNTGGLCQIKTSTGKIDILIK